jgi:hypothetical protein
MRKTRYLRQQRLPLMTTKSNALIRSAVNVRNHPLANKLFGALVRAIDPTTFPDVDTIDSSHLVFEDEQREKSGGQWYKRLNAACAILASAFVELCELNEDKWTRIPIMSQIVYEKGRVTASFNQRLKPHLVELQRFFTSYNALEHDALNGFYAPRLFEYLKSWEKGNESGMFEIKLEGQGGLYHVLTIPLEYQKRFCDLKRILEQCHREITTKTTLNYSWIALKFSRKFVAIRFDFRPEEETKFKLKAQKRARRDQAKSNNALFKLVLNCLKEQKIPEGSSQPCPAERPARADCKLCAKIFRAPSLLPPDPAPAESPAA